MRRRRFILIAAAAVGLPLPRRGAAPGPELTVWRGS
jgi:hypothetical protein